MPLEQVFRDHPLSKHEFHQRLRQWFDNSDDLIVGPENIPGVTCWVYVRDGSDIFGLHADTKRDAVGRYLQLVEQYGDTLQWEITESQRDKRTAVVHGPKKVRDTSFYLYYVGPSI